MKNQLKICDLIECFEFHGGCVGPSEILGGERENQD